MCLLVYRLELYVEIVVVRMMRLRMVVVFGILMRLKIWMKGLVFLLIFVYGIIVIMMMSVLM